MPTCVAAVDSGAGYYHTMQGLHVSVMQKKFMTMMMMKMTVGHHPPLERDQIVSRFALELATEERGPRGVVEETRDQEFDHNQGRE